MSRQPKLSDGPYRHLALLGVVLVLTLVEIFLIYSIKRSYTIDLGEAGDGAFVTGFWADEPDVGFRYRWSKDVSAVTFLGAGSARPQRLTVWAQGPILPGISPVITMSMSLNGVPIAAGPMSLSINGFPSSIGPIVLNGEMSPYSFELPPQPDKRVLSTPYVLTIYASTFHAAGDSRTLGAKIDKVVLDLQPAGFNLPPLDILFWLLLFSAGIVGLLLPLPWPSSAWLAVLVAGLPALAVAAIPHYVAAYLPPIALPMALAGALVWQRRHIPRWPFAADHPGARPRAATWLMLAAILIFAAVSLRALPQVVWIGHADYAENANIARSLVEGRGFTVDYVAQFYNDYPGISHPAETWPLLQPLLIAPFFAIFGPVTWAAKLPNLFVLLALSWGVFSLASRLWDARVGLLAGLLTLLHPYFFNAVLYPINDLAFTAIFFALAWLIWRSLYGLTIAGAAQEGRPWGMVSIGFLAGLLIWSKPSGASLLLGLMLWSLALWWRHKGHKAAVPWRSIVTAGTAFSLVLLPLLLRNLLAFGKPYFSTESLDAWILRYWPYHDWEDIYKVYVGAADYPHPRWVVGGKFGYQNLSDAIAINFRWVWERGVHSGIKGSDFVISAGPLLGALLGFGVLSRRVALLFVMVLSSIAIYALFVLLYWHFEGRYFQVAIPWLYMLLAWGVVWLWDTVRARLPRGTSRAADFVVLPLAGLVLLWPSLGEIRDYLRNDTRPTSFTVAMDWLSSNSSPADVVMTRDPWELNWYTRSKAVMIPDEDLATIKRIAAQYGVTMLQLGGPADGIRVDDCPADTGSSAPFPTGSRPALGKLYCGYELPGFTRVYRNGDLTIYRLSP